MSLREYREKRSFEKTPEPKPAKEKPAHGREPVFCVQRHDATRLHYDFRLEMEGVLKSWAVPKGPSLEPLSKHLAMHVEDHPFDYGDFEGNIPKGQYGGGSVMLWDRGTYELLGDISGPDQIARGDLKFRLHGEKVKGEFALVLMRGRGKGNEWLLIKKKDDEAKPGWNVEDYAYSVKTGRTQQEIAEDLPAKKKTSKAIPNKRSFNPGKVIGAIKAAMPKAVTPMLATLTGAPPAGKDWLYEVKWDGVRAICFVQDGKLRIESRSGKRCEQQYPELQVLPHYVAAGEAILDGEITVLDAQGRSRFELIQPRIGVGDPNTIAHRSRSTPVTLFVFDLLYLDGFDLRKAPLVERRRALESVLKPGERIRISDAFPASGEQMLEAARKHGLEGVVGKRAESAYEGKRSREWLKIKVEKRQEFVIGGFMEGEREHFGSLVLGLYEKGKLIPVGQVGTGFDAKTMKAIFEKLEPLIVKKSPFAKRIPAPRGITWVRPELVCEVKFLEFTKDGFVRAPVYIGLREDKNSNEVVRETAETEPAENADGALQLDSPKKEILTQVDGHQLKFTNLDKIFWPKDRITKRALIEYYDAVSALLLPHLRDRPLSLKRFPNGIEGKYFFQKDSHDQFPDWMQTETIWSEDSKRDIRYAIANDRATLLYLANLACIDQNPWMSRIGSLENPDYVLVDLDPQECTYDEIVEAALLVKNKLEFLGLEGYPKTTGGDGMHVYVPLEPVYTYEQARSFAEILSHLVVNEQPDLFTTPRSVSKRQKGRVYFDYLQISTGKTIAAPYVLRAFPGAPVSTPLDWNEVKKGLRPDQFTIRNAVERFDRVGDLFAAVLEKPQKLEKALARLGGQMDTHKNK
ncbi:MAG TPA: DNA ligase D [Bryobacteraceae bacterium]|nr:DNA ligase D [Bryobacteraceae bacterium]